MKNVIFSVLLACVANHVDVHSFVLPSFDSSGWVSVTKPQQKQQNVLVADNRIVELDLFGRNVLQLGEKSAIWKLYSSLESETTSSSSSTPPANSSNRPPANSSNRPPANSSNRPPPNSSNRPPPQRRVSTDGRSRSFSGNHDRRNNSNNGNRRPAGGPGGGRQSDFQRRNPGGFRPESSVVLVNPLKLKKLVNRDRPQQRDDRGDGRGRGGRSAGGRGGRDGGRGGRDGGGRGRGSAGGRGPPGGGDDSSSAVDRGPRKQFSTVAPKKKVYGQANPDTRKQRVSLRINTSNKKSRGGGMRRGSLKKKNRAREKEARYERALEGKRVFLPTTPQTVGQLSELLEEKPTAIIKYLITDLGVMAGITQSLDVNTMIAVVQGFGKIVAGSDDDYEDEYDEDDEEDEEDSALESGVAIDEDDADDLLPRAPVVTIMGHVDHGKTSLIDSLRNTDVVKGEAGGITQHIAAYQIQHKGSPITFIDTPGHAAFSDMRSRGANITDIVVLVVAADDSVKQQTADSIICARQAGVPLVVAINKCDLETADTQRVKSDLAAYDVLVEDLGGDIQCAEISAKENLNIDELLSKIMLQAELQDLKANPNRNAQGQIIEARVEKGLGCIATTLIQRGTLKIGDSFLAGETFGKVRALFIDDGKTKVEEVGPSVPVSIVGFDGVPRAGDLFIVTDDEQAARELAASRQRIARERESSSYQIGLMQSVASAFTGEKQKQVKEMCVLVKADVQGSAEALGRSLSDLSLENDEAIVTIKVLVQEAGDVSKSDIAIASVTPGTTVIAFNCAANMAAMDDARTLNILPIEYYSVVYDAIESVECRMQEILSPTPDGEYVGKALVQEVFNIGGLGNIAGSKCEDGFIKKGSNVRVMRGDKILCESKVKTLRNFKSEVDQIDVGDECGIGLIGYEEFQVGDIIESYVVKK